MSFNSTFYFLGCGRNCIFTNVSKINTILTLYKPINNLIVTFFKVNINLDIKGGMKLIKQNNELSSSPSAFSFRSIFSWRLLIRFALFSLFWGLITRWKQNYLDLGIAFIAMASMLSLYLTPQQKNDISG
jgi:hypothetical protein